MKKKLLSTLLLFGVAIAANAQIPTEMTARFQTVMDSIVTNFEAGNSQMGLSMAVSIPGYGTWEGASGHAQQDVAMTADMTAGIGSNSKLVTAVIMLKLQEAGILSLDDQVAQWIPDELHDIDKTATIRQLLQHETGFFDYTNDREDDFIADVFADTEHFWSYAELIDRIGAPHFDVGTAFRYSNTNYLLAAWIIENATGNSLAHNLHQYITTPLGMERTFDSATDNEGLDGTQESWGYAGGFWWPRLGSVAMASMWRGAGSIVATPDDIAAFYQALFNSDYLTAASKAQLMDFEPSSQYGLAVWDAISFPLEAQMYWHGGDVIFHSRAAYDPLTHASIFFVINNDDADLAGVSDVCYTTLFTAMREYFPKQENDAGISRIISPVSSGCQSTVAPVVVIKNYGSGTLTAATIDYRIDNGAPATYSWSGSLANGETAEVTLPVIPATEGAHTFTAWTASSNGSAEVNTNNDSTSAGFAVNPETVTLTSFSEDFEGGSTSIALWNPYQLHVGQWGVTKLTGSSGHHSLARDSFRFELIGDESYADLPMLQLGAGAQELRFTYACSTWPGAEDTLEVLVSNDCGDTWDSLFNRSGEELSYGLLSNTTGINWGYYPQTSEEWHTEVLPLDAYSGSDILVRFREVNGYSDNIFLDDISVGAALATAHFDKSKVLVYPNPASDRVTISGLPDETVISLYTISGQKIRETVSNGDTAINLSGLAPGMYFVNTAYGSTKIMKK